MFPCRTKIPSTRSIQKHRIFLESIKFISLVDWWLAISTKRTKRRSIRKYFVLSRDCSNLARVHETFLYRGVAKTCLTGHNYKYAALYPLLCSFWAPSPRPSHGASIKRSNNQGWEWVWYVLLWYGVLVWFVLCIWLYRISSSTMVKSLNYVCPCMLYMAI